MVKFTDVSYGFPQKDLYNKICFEIEENEHVVLIGSNGTGKSTLIDMIANTEEYLYDGKIEIKEGTRIGMVSQFVKHESDDITSYDFLAQPFIDLQRQSDEICAEMGTAENMDEVYERYQKCLDEIEAVDGYNYDTNIKKQLATAGLSHLEKISVHKISGGEFKLLSIIRNMLMKPQLLIMDEPDVFLDFENIIGLSKLINQYEGTLLAITHNRLLLSQCFNKVLHLENEELQEYPGTFAEYNHDMLETKINMLEQATKDAEMIEVQQQYVNKLRAEATRIDSPTKGRQLKARATYLARLQARQCKNPFIEDHNYDFTFPEIDAVESMEGAALATEKTVESMEGAALATEKTVESMEGAAGIAQFQTVEEVHGKTIINKKPVIEIKDYSLTYDKCLLSNVSFSINAGDKVAIVGANGTGKSSMLRDIYEMMKKEDSAKVGYFSQIYDDDDSVKLSGGERNIKQLLDIAAGKASILFLDEPTSHLDTYAQLALEKAIGDYKGTVLMISHDFYTVANCVDRILLLEDGTVREVSGRSYRKSVYKKYFDSDIFEQERIRRDTEIKVNTLLKVGKYAEARQALC